MAVHVDASEHLVRVATCPWHSGFPPFAILSNCGPSTTFPRAERDGWDPPRVADCRVVGERQGSTIERSRQEDREQEGCARHTAQSRSALEELLLAVALSSPQ